MKIKICGINSLEAALAARGSGADFLGLIFAENSPRKIEISEAEKISNHLKGAKLVGVFQNQSEDFILKTQKSLNLFAIQLHGNEDEAFAASLAKKTKAKIWKAFCLGSESDVISAAKFPAETIVADARQGGSGKTSNWDLAGRLSSLKKLVLAGGISSENAKEAFKKTNPSALDLNSSLEDKKGIKSISKIITTMKTLKKSDKTRYGIYGGTYVAETLAEPLRELEETFAKAKKSAKFKAEFGSLLKDYVGRPSPLYFAKRLTEYCGGANIYLKREDLNHTGAHKINNALGQALLAKQMGKTRLIAETGAGMHGVVTATVAALLRS